MLPCYENTHGPRHVIQVVMSVTLLCVIMVVLNIESSTRDTLVSKLGSHHRISKPSFHPLRATIHASHVFLALVPVFFLCFQSIKRSASRDDFHTFPHEPEMYMR